MTGSKQGTLPSLHVAGAIGRGEVWIRTDDGQIVRQLVALSFEMEGDLGIPGASPTFSKSTFEVSFDLKYSRIGEPVSPAITAPPIR